MKLKIWRNWTAQENSGKAHFLNNRPWKKSRQFRFIYKMRQFTLNFEIQSRCEQIQSYIRFWFFSFFFSNHFFGLFKLSIILELSTITYSTLGIGAFSWDLKHVFSGILEFFFFSLICKGHNGFLNGIKVGDISRIDAANHAAKGDP